MCGDHDIVKSGFYLSFLFGMASCLVPVASSHAHEHGTAADFQATSAIPKLDRRVFSPSPGELNAIGIIASIPDPALIENGQSGLTITPITMVGRWTIKSVRTQDNNLRKVQKILLNPAVLTLRKNGQFTMTTGCAHNTGTILWNEEQFSLGMVLSNETKCNKAQRQVEQRILQILHQVSQLERKDADQVSFQDESGQDLITLSRAE
ncbi:MAG TPA: META domain-containing protein [Rhizobiales bacterium]|uniref:META domain-containing protein n=1 Tax=Cohaesibacter gelatinilyticus TaxID=372072 RepID=A0A285PIM9_9HYPH|nr:META domain-containing protein [Cohaesibacter gelatinilyticus]HAT85368.1 META domain-containing protein [Hyphomicrobiales bacterium]